MLKRINNKVYIKHKNEKISGYFLAILSAGILCIGIIDYFNKITEINFENKGFSMLLENDYLEGGFIKILFENKWVVLFLQSSLAKILLTIGLIIFFVIFIIKIFFTQNYDYHIDIEEKRIHLINGKWKFGKEIILDFNEIKSIIIVHFVTKEDTTNEESYEYKIDIYDIELNAYEIYDHSEYEITREIAFEIGEILNIEVIDKADVENYEGFRQRVI
jgi:hypothetical protein